MREDAIVERDRRSPTFGFPNDEAAFVFSSDVEPATTFTVGSEEDLISSSRVDRACERWIEANDTLAARQPRGPVVFERCPGRRGSKGRHMRSAPRTQGGIKARCRYRT